MCICITYGFVRGADSDSSSDMWQESAAQLLGDVGDGQRAEVYCVASWSVALAIPENVLNAKPSPL